jgi:hypothetical protein
MTTLPRDVVTSIFEYVSYGTLNQFLTDYSTDWTIPLSIQQHIEDKKKFILEHIPSVLIDMFTLSEFLDAAVLKWKDAFLGWTDYIDSIQTSDVESALSIGVDPYHRAFVCMRIVDIERENTFVYTLFQRYSHDMTSWTYGCHYPSFLKTSGYVIVQNTLRHKDFEDTLHKLMSRKPHYFRMNSSAALRPFCLV